MLFGIWLCVFSIIYNDPNVSSYTNIRMNTHRIFFIRNIRKRIKTVRRNIVRYDFLFTFAKQMNYNVKIIFILNC